MRIQEAIDILNPEGNSKDEIRSAYRKAARKYHPDRVRDIGSEMMKLINLAYETLKQNLESVKWNWTRKDVNVEDAIDEMMLNIFDQIKRFYGIKVELCGTWLWISGDTYRYKKEFKDLDFKWSRNKSMWYWHAPGYRKHSGKEFSIDEIRDKFGNTKLETEPSNEIEEAA